MKKHSFHSVPGNIGLLCFFVVFTHLQSGAQTPAGGVTDTFDINQASFRLPLPKPGHKYMHAISFLHLLVPKDWTLDYINAPMFSYEAKYSLPKGFTLEGSLSTLLISNRINLGPFWNYKKDRYSFGVGYQFAFSYGVLKQFGFNTKLTIWEQQPSITLGYSFAKTALILKGDMIWTTSLDQFQGGHKLSSDGSMVNGYSMSATFEQRLWKNKLLFFAVKINDIRYHIVAWPALPVNQYRYWVPETQIGIVF